MHWRHSRLLLASLITNPVPLPHHCQPQNLLILIVNSRFFSSTADYIDNSQKPTLRTVCREMVSRGILASTFPNTLMSQQFVDLPSFPKLYLGIDPTADSLHLGHLLVLTALFRARLVGCEAIVLLGGVSAIIGDPSGRIDERTLLSLDKSLTNSGEIEKQIKMMDENIPSVLDELSIVCHSEIGRLDLLNNISWFGTMNMLRFFEMSRSFRVGEMLRSVRSRMIDHRGVSFPEFAYQIVQGLDWLHLCQHFDCTVQLGGEDQLGNFDTGRELIRKIANKQSWGLFTSFVVDRFGDKLGKSTNNAGTVWLGRNYTSPYQLYQFFRQKADFEIGHLMRLFSFRPLEQVNKLMDSHQMKPSECAAQIALAREMTLLIHGESGLKSAERCTRALFTSSFESISTLDVVELESLFGNGQLSSINLHLSQVDTVLDLVRMVFNHSVSKSSSGHARTIIGAGGFRVNGQKFADPDEKVSDHVFLPNTRLSVICLGKRNYSLIRWQ